MRERFAGRAAGVLGVVLAVAAGAGESPGELTAEQRKRLEGEANELNERGLALYQRRDYAGAVALLEQALELRRKLHPLGHADVATNLNNLGVLLRSMGELKKAEPNYRQALEMRQRLYPKERFPQGHPELAQSLSNLGALLWALGESFEAEPPLRQAVAMRQRLYPKERFPQGHPELAHSLNNLASVLQAQGELGQAESSYRQALQMRQQLFPESRHPDGHPDLAQSLSNLGFLLQAQGEYARAEPLYREALAMRRRLYPEERFPRGHPDLALSLSNLGALLQDQGEYRSAEDCHGQALRMRQRLYPEDRFPRGHPDLAQGLTNLGFLMHVQGKYGKAEPHYLQALQMRQRLYPGERFPQGHPELALSLDNLGVFELSRGEPKKAESYCRLSLQMYQRLYPKGRYPHGHPDLATSLTNLGAVLWARGEHRKAEPPLRQGLAMFQSHLHALADLAAEATALNAAAALPLARDVLLSVTRRQDGLPDPYDLLWQGKAALTRVLERRHLDLVASLDRDARKLADDLHGARQRLARALLRPGTEPVQHARHVARLTEEKEELERRLARQLRLALPSRTAAPAPEELARALPEGAAFIDLLRHANLEQDPRVPGKKGERRTRHYTAFLLQRGKPPGRVELGPAGPIEDAWRGWRRAVEAGRDDRKEAARLARLAWAPLRERLPAGVKTVYLSPDGPLGGVPWGALPGSKPGTVVLEECAVAVVAHGPWLLDRLRDEPAPPGAAGTLLAVGAVNYEKAPAPAAKALGDEGAVRAATLGGPRVVWKELPGTAREQQQVAGLARKALKTEPILRGERAADTAQLEADLPRARWVHLATHGFFADPRFRSALQLDEKLFERLTLRREAAGGRSPLVLSGLVLAGANRQGKEAAADRGILSAEGIVGLNLGRMELAVLSACDTGLGELGDVAGGEGVLGLQRAFHLAGCKNVVASLWKVDDDATAALMGLFYRNLWVEKLAPLEALRQAQLALYRNPDAVAKLAARRGADFAERDLPEVTAKPVAKEKRAHTSLWAAFVLSGTGR